MIIAFYIESSYIISILKDVCYFPADLSLLATIAELRMDTLQLYLDRLFSKGKLFVFLLEPNHSLMHCCQLLIRYLSFLGFQNKLTILLLYFLQIQVFPFIHELQLFVFLTYLLQVFFLYC